MKREYFPVMAIPHVKQKINYIRAHLQWRRLRASAIGYLARSSFALTTLSTSRDRPLNQALYRSAAPEKA